MRVLNAINLLLAAAAHVASADGIALWGRPTIGQPPAHPSQEKLQACTRRGLTLPYGVTRPTLEATSFRCGTALRVHV